MKHFYSRFSRKDNFKIHLLVHYKNDIKSQYVSETNETKCTICDFEARDLKTLVYHIALKDHQRLKEYIPTFAAESLFGERTQNQTKRDAASTDDESEAVTDSILDGNENSWNCCVCKQDFTDHTQLTDHIGET